ncbi:MAG: hypothetical protein NTY98_04940 [Verrucomicrobia bacterium]|nr:hypothetical protein [Verrucomicrobiota bacterium]
MPEFVKKSAPVFLSRTDEDTFARRLRVLVPDVLFVDGQRWSSSVPPAHSLISSCLSNLVYIWSPNTCAELPYKKLPSGVYQGPISGVVIQFVRCKQTDHSLLSGDIGIGYDKNDSRMVCFVDKVWNTLRALNATKLESINPDNGGSVKRGIKNYIVGPHAKELSSEGIPLKHSDVEVYYRAES